MTNDIELEIDDDPAWDAEPNPELVRWQPSHKPDAVQTGGPRLSPATALGVIAIGSAIAGAVAVGALAIGALAIGQLAVGNARFRRLEVDDLVIGKVRFKR